MKYIENYNKYRKAFQEKGLIAVPVKGTTSESEGKAPYSNSKYNRFTSFHSFKERPFTEEEMNYYFSTEKGEIGLGVVLGSVKNKEDLFLIGFDVDKMVQGDLLDFCDYCVDQGLAYETSARKGVHIYGYSRNAFADTRGIQLTLGEFVVEGDLWGAGSMYFVTTPTKIKEGEYKADTSFIEALFAGDFNHYPQYFLSEFERGSKARAEQIRSYTNVRLDKTDVESFVKAYSHTKIGAGERHDFFLAVCKDIYKRIYREKTCDEAISLAFGILKSLRDSGLIEKGNEKTDKELQDIATYCYGYRKKWEDEISTPEFQAIIDEYRKTGEISPSVDDYKQKYIKAQVNRNFDVDKHKKAVDKLKKVKDSMIGLEGKALTEAKNTAIMLREFVYNEAYKRIIYDRPNLKYDAQGDRIYDYIHEKGVYREIERKIMESEVMASLTSFGLDSHATRTKAQDTITRMLIGINKFVPTSSPSITCVGNGLLNIDTGAFTSWTPAFVTTTRISTKYNPEAVVKGSRWEKFVEEVTCGDKEQARLLQQFAGYLLSPTTKYQKALLLVGEGSNGKGVFSRALKGVVGEEAYSVMKAEDLNKNFGVANLVNKRLNICDETTDKYLDTHVLKGLISGEDQVCDVKHKNQIHFTPEVKIIMTVNDMPTVSDTSYGFYRRFIPISFDAKFSKEDGNMDSALSSKLEKEDEVIFMWAYEGYKDLTKEGSFTTTAKNDEALIDYKISNDITERFVINNFITSPGYEVSLMSVYTAYRNYSKDVGKLPKNISNFSKDLRRTTNYGKLYVIEERQHGKDQAKIIGVEILESQHHSDSISLDF